MNSRCQSSGVEDVVLVQQTGRGGAPTRTKTRVNIFVGNGKEHTTMVQIVFKIEFILHIKNCNMNMIDKSKLNTL